MIDRQTETGAIADAENDCREGASICGLLRSMISKIIARDSMQSTDSPPALRRYFSRLVLRLQACKSASANV